MCTLAREAGGDAGGEAGGGEAGGGEADGEANGEAGDEAGGEATRTRGTRDPPGLENTEAGEAGTLWQQTTTPQITSPAAQ